MRLADCMNIDNSTTILLVSIAPLVYAFLQIVMFGICIKFCNGLLDFSKPETNLLWIDVIFVIVFYSLTAFRDVFQIVFNII